MRTGGLAMGNAQSEELQERLGERLGLVLIFAGVLVIALGVTAFAWWTDSGVWNAVAIGTALVVVIGAVILILGVVRVQRFRKSPVYAKYMEAKRQHQIACADAKKLSQVQPPQSAQASQQTTVREREVRTEVVMIKCSYCGSLNDQTAKSCCSCGARM
jgi:hypothetical protein